MTLSAVGFIPFVEVALRPPVFETGDVCFAAQQVRHPGCEAPFWNQVPALCDFLQGPTKQHGERLAL